MRLLHCFQYHADVWDLPRSFFHWIHFGQLNQSFLSCNTSVSASHVTSKQVWTKYRRLYSMQFFFCADQVRRSFIYDIHGVLHYRLKARMHITSHYIILSFFCFRPIVRIIRRSGQYAPVLHNTVEDEETRNWPSVLIVTTVLQKKKSWIPII